MAAHRANPTKVATGFMDPVGFAASALCSTNGGQSHGAPPTRWSVVLEQSDGVSSLRQMLSRARRFRRRVHPKQLMTYTLD